MAFPGVPIRLFAKVDSLTHERTIHHRDNIADADVLELLDVHRRRALLSLVRENSAFAARR
jgi:hypothetical protein